MKKLTKVIAAIMLLFGMLLVVGCGKEPVNPTPTQQEVNWVDLGLPSGLLWAMCNVGATSPEDFGDYFAWGEVAPKSVYNWSTYRYCNGDFDQLTKYCCWSSYGYNGYSDQLTTLQPGDDAATANCGGRIPTKGEWQELMNNTTSSRKTINGVNVLCFTSSNGESLIFPDAGYRWDSTFSHVGQYGNYWSSSYNTGSPNYAWYFYFDSDTQGMNNYGYRMYGMPVRAVRSARSSCIVAHNRPFRAFPILWGTNIQ